jgi:GNAT superfamily N-acetyltransferase
MCIELKSFDSSNDLLIDEAVRLYLASWGGEFDSVKNFIAHYAEKQDFYGYLAYDGNYAVACTFGSRSAVGEWWHDAVAAHVGKENPAIQDAWALVELDVLPDYRSQAIGARLHDTVLSYVTQPNLLLSTQVTNLGAQRFYERRGWSILHPGFVFRDGQQRFLVMHKAN